MTRVCNSFPIRSIDKVSDEYLTVVLHAPPLAEHARPGQFLHVRCAGSHDWDPLLRRPYSFYWANPETGEAAFLLKIVGRGSTWLAGRQPGDVLDVLGPLGNPWRLPDSLQRAALVGGGVGVPPLYFLAQHLLPDIPCAFFIGARTQEQLVGVEEGRALGADVRLATDDGSQGFHGTNVALLARALQEGEAFDWIASCGPWPMMAAAVAVAEEHHIACQVSLEARMGCGLGVCLSCVVRTTAEGWKSYQRVCTEGPVFDAREVVWSEYPL